MILTHKFRVYPTRTQERIMDETLETCRRQYNVLLSDRIESRSGFYEQSKKLVALKRDNKYLQAVHSQVLQDVNLRLDKAYQAFFARLSKYPRFRRRGKYNSFAYPQHDIGFKLSGNFLKLGKIGNARIRLHRQITGTLKRATIIKEIDQWFAALSVEVEGQKTAAGKKPEGIVGVDLGISNLLALSSGELIPNPK